MTQKQYEPGIYVVLDGDIQYVDAYDGKYWQRWNGMKNPFPIVQVLAGPIPIGRIAAANQMYDACKSAMLRAMNKRNMIGDPEEDWPEIAILQAALQKADSLK